MEPSGEEKFFTKFCMGYSAPRKPSREEKFFIKLYMGYWQQAVLLACAHSTEHVALSNKFVTLSYEIKIHSCVSCLSSMHRTLLPPYRMIHLRHLHDPSFEAPS